MSDIFFYSTFSLSERDQPTSDPAGKTVIVLVLCNNLLNVFGMYIPCCFVTFRHGFWGAMSIDVFMYHITILRLRLAMAVNDREEIALYLIRGQRRCE